MSPLATELSKPEYAGLSDQAAADAVNAKTVAVHQTVAISKVKEYAIVNGIWPKLRLGAVSSNPAISGMCVSILDWVDDPRISTLDVNLPQVQAMLSSLVSAGIISEQQKSEVIAMGIGSAPWTQFIGIDFVGDGHVHSARLEIQEAN